MAKPALIENIDYTVENGNYVFTSSYLLGRGYCCGNGCRNCPYGDAKLRVVSMVPSWTETLLACGANVVGRTRFCIHPKGGVSAIKAVGGTKDWKLELVAEIKPDLIVLDREENPIAMAEKAPAEYFASHIRSVSDMAPELERMAKLFEQADDTAVAAKLEDLAGRWRKVDACSVFEPSSAKDLPGVLDWIGEPSPLRRCVYFIWKKPWMAAASGTFISSVLAKLGVENILADTGTKYPEINLESLPAETLLLFSSEPYPFRREITQIRELGRPAAVVDGESFSWFGIRSLAFLEEALGLSRTVR